MSGEPDVIRLTRAQFREIDRLSIEKYHIPGIVLMENAASGVAVEVMKMINPVNASVIIVCGRGNNGGDGYAIARHLQNAGVRVSMMDTGGKLSGDALTNQTIARAMGIETHFMDAYEQLKPDRTDLIIDALFGTGLTRPVDGDMKILIQTMNESRVPILAVDVPSGLDCDTGEPLGACVQATCTVTFVAEKAGFANPNSRQFTGDVVIAGIGCPRELIVQVLQ